MPGLFLSYRRDDTMGWAGRLFADLARRIGPGRVFMDINGGIPRGADFERTLETALNDCDALLALIGPRWLSCTRDGSTRRIDAPDDWVRTEIATALRRSIVVVPVLLGRTPLPCENDLPEELHALAGRQLAEITDERWDFDLAALIKDLSSSLAWLRDNDASRAANGFELLGDLISNHAVVADAVAASREVLAATYAQVNRLEVLKNLHDALHAIEFECLRPMSEGSSGTRLRPYRVKFDGIARRMNADLAGECLAPGLRQEVVDQLEAAQEALRAVAETPSDVAFQCAMSELAILIGSIPPRLDTAITDAAADLKLDRLIELMGRVRAAVASLPGGDASRVAPFLESVAALERLRDELARRVLEHSSLQRLDSRLRTIVVGGLAPGTLAGEWKRVRLVRSRLLPPHSEPLAVAVPDLTQIEGEMDAALAAPGEEAATEIMREYARVVGSVFRDVDSGLRELCLLLGEIARPMKSVLELSEART